MVVMLALVKIHAINATMDLLLLMVNVSNVQRIVIHVLLMVNVLLAKKIVTYLMINVLTIFLVTFHVMNVLDPNLINVLSVVRIEFFMMEFAHVKLVIQLMRLILNAYLMMKTPYPHQNKYKED